MFQIDITGIGAELQGVGRLPDGRAVFVPGAIPGETVKIEITAEKGRFCEASLIEVVIPSPDRVSPDCPHAGLCGGCQARHMRYHRTLALKRQVVADALSRIGGLDQPEVRETIGCDHPERTRNKAEYPIAFVNGQPVIGTYARSSHTVLPLDDCLHQAPESIRALREIGQWLPRFPLARHLKGLVTRVNSNSEVMAILTGDAPIQSELTRQAPRISNLLSLWYCQLNRRPTHALDGRCTRISGKATITESLFNLTFELAPQSFFQVNRSQTEHLYQIAMKAAGIKPGSNIRLLDAYCGVGTISLCAAESVQSVTGIEIVPPAIENARRNAQINGISNARFICADAAREIPALLARKNHFDATILDPPRKGADPALLQALAHAQIPTITYVSCNPATLARDIKTLRSLGYHARWAQPVDMFPWTGHVETVVLMSRK